MHNTNKKRRPPKHNLVGKKYHHLTVEEMAITSKSKDKCWRAICRCDCGNVADVNTNYLMRGLAKTCGAKACVFHRQDYTNSGKNNVKFTGYEGIHGSKWSGMKCGAKRRGIIFNVTIQEVWQLFEKQQKKCALTGLEIGFGRTYTDGNTASLDRIDSNQGYVIDNLQWVHKDVNKMKFDTSVDRFIEICNLVTLHNRGKDEQKTKERQF